MVWDWPLQKADGEVSLVNNKKHFEADFEVSTFRPHDIEVKVLGNGLILHFHSEMDIAQRTMAREIHRTYKLPPDVDVSTLKTSMKPNGILHIVAKKIPTSS